MIVTGIGQLVTNDPERGGGRLGIVEDAVLVVEHGRVAWAGSRQQAPEQADGPRIDAGGACMLPGFVDAHTHLVFAGDRAAEFGHRMSGHAYEAGGIAATVAATRAASDEELRALVLDRAAEALAGGTTTMEVKSGYGLTVKDERRCLEAAGALAQEAPVQVSRTFLGAHVVPPEYADDPDGYVALVAGPMLDACAAQADWCDVFCDRGAFNIDQARAVLEAGRAHGLGLRMHTNQLGTGPGARLAAELGAASADHLVHIDDEDIAALGDAGVVATLVPGAEFSTRSPYAPARRLLDAGVTVALATDCNPGTSYTTSMPFVIALAVRELRMTPEEAVWSATAGGAVSLRRDDVGRLRAGARADFMVLKAPSPIHLAYRPGVSLVRLVVSGGEVAYAGT